MDSSLDQKRKQLLDKYKNLFIQKTGLNGTSLDNYVNTLIGIGEKYYGDNFTEDILREKRDDSILWLIDEVSRYSWMDSRNLTANSTPKGLPAGNPATENLENNLSGAAPKELPAGKDEQEKGQMLANAFAAVADKKAEEKKGQMLANAFAAVADQKAEEEKVQANENTKSDVDPMLAGALTDNNVLNNADIKEEAIKSNVDPVLAGVFTNLTGRSVDLENNDITEPMEPINDDINNTQPLPEVINEGNTIPATAKVGKRKEAPKGLIGKFKEKWKDPKFKKKLLVGAIAIGVIGIGVIAATAISQIMSTQSLDTNMIVNANHLTSSLIDGLDLNSISNSVDPSAVSGTEYMDYTVNAGDTVYSNAADAMSGQNGVAANEWFTDQPQGIYDTVNNEWVDTSNVDFNNVEDMKQFMDGNHAIVEGGNGDLDGFRPIDESMIKTK